MNKERKRDFSFADARCVADRELVNDWKKARSKATDRYTIRDAVKTWANPAIYGTLLERFYSCVLISCSLGARGSRPFSAWVKRVQVGKEKWRKRWSGGGEWDRVYVTSRDNEFPFDTLYI